MATQCSRMLNKEQSFKAMNPSGAVPKVVTTFLDQIREKTPIIGRLTVLNEIKALEGYTNKYFHLGVDDGQHVVQTVWDPTKNGAYLNALIQLIEKDRHVLLVLKNPLGKDITKRGALVDKFINYSSVLKANLVDCEQPCCILAMELHWIFNSINNRVKVVYLEDKQLEMHGVQHHYSFFEISKRPPDLKDESIDVFVPFQKIIDETVPNANGGKPQKAKKLILGRWRNVYMVKVADAPRKVPMANYQGSMVPVSYLRSLEKNRIKS